jgi:hypothetical protein
MVVGQGRGKEGERGRWGVRERGKKKKKKKKGCRVRGRLGADVNATGLECSQIGDQPALHVEAEGILPDPAVNIYIFYTLSSLLQTDR